MHEYTIKTSAGMETTVLLTDEDAEARGLKPNAAKAKTPANKQATPANKSRGASNKQAEAASQAFGGKSKAASED